MTLDLTARIAGLRWWLGLVLAGVLALSAAGQPGETPAAPGPSGVAEEKAAEKKAAEKKAAAAAKNEARPALHERVVTIGASLTCGFGNELPLAGPLDRAIVGKHERVFNAGAGLQFMNPVGSGEEQIDTCLDRKPTLVIGIDFLFWYGYGLSFRGKTEGPRRAKRFALGLAQLERLTCPVVVGDLPDMRGAHKRMLHPAMIPSPDVLADLNRRLREWAAGRKNIHIVPLAAWVKTLKAGEWKVPASQDGKHPERILTTAVAMQWDGLHPTRVGTLVLTGRLVGFMAKHLGPEADRFRYDVWQEVTRYGKPRPAPQSKPPARAPREPASSPRQPSGSGR